MFVLKRRPCLGPGGAGGGEDHRFNEHQAAHEIGPGQRHAQGHRAAEGMAKEVDGRALPQSLGYGDGVGGGGVVEIGHAVPIGCATVADLVKAGEGEVRQPLGQT
jgi:hypothetical protein